MPVWRITIKLGDVFHNDEIVFTEKRDIIVGRIKESGWRDISAQQIDLDELIDELSEVLNRYEFNSVWGELYDIADLDRVWIETF